MNNSVSQILTSQLNYCTNKSPMTPFSSQILVTIKSIPNTTAGNLLKYWKTKYSSLPSLWDPSGKFTAKWQCSQIHTGKLGHWPIYCWVLIGSPIWHFYCTRISKHLVKKRSKSPHHISFPSGKHLKQVLTWFKKKKKKANEILSQLLILSPLQVNSWGHLPAFATEGTRSEIWPGPSTSALTSKRMLHYFKRR